MEELPDKTPLEHISGLALCMWELKGRGGSLDICSKGSERERDWPGSHNCFIAEPAKPEYSPPWSALPTPSRVVWASTQQHSPTPHTPAAGQGLEDVWVPPLPTVPQQELYADLLQVPEEDIRVGCPSPGDLMEEHYLISSRLLTWQSYLLSEKRKK